MNSAAFAAVLRPMYCMHIATIRLKVSWYHATISRRKLAPALQQTEAPPTELCCTLTELRRTHTELRCTLTELCCTLIKLRRTLTDKLRTLTVLRRITLHGGGMGGGLVLQIRCQYLDGLGNLTGQQQYSMTRTKRVP